MSAIAQAMAVDALDAKKRAWLDAFRAHGMVSKACEATGCPRSSVYVWRQRDEEFALAWADIEEATTERMEREAYRRAVEGVVDKIHVNSAGEVVGEEIKYSDTLLIFMLKARRPEKYRDNIKVEHAGGIDHRGAVLVTDPELAEEARALLRRAASAGSD